MAALDRAVASAENGDAPAVPEQLRLDVPGALEVALAEDRAVAEGRLRLTASRREGLVQVCRRADDAHAAAAAACRGLDDEREADLVGRSLRQRRNAALDRDPLGRELVATQPERLGRGADPGHAGRDHRLGECGVSRPGSRSRDGLRRLRRRPRRERARTDRDTTRSRSSCRPSARGANRGHPARRRRPSRCRGGHTCERRGQRSLPGSRRVACGSSQADSMPRARRLPGRDERDGDERARDSDVLQS